MAAEGGSRVFPLVTWLDFPESVAPYVGVPEFLHLIVLVGGYPTTLVEDIAIL